MDIMLELFYLGIKIVYYDYVLTLRAASILVFRFTSGLIGKYRIAAVTLPRSWQILVLQEIFY